MIDIGERMREETVFNWIISCRSRCQIETIVSFMYKMRIKSKRLDLEIERMLENF